MKKLLKILSVALTAVLIITTFSIGMSAYAATDDVIGNYNFEITSTYENVDWENWKPYKAATHVHTTRSDADVEVEDMIEEYYRLGYDALALTDHGTVNYGWTSGQKRITIFDYQFFVHGGLDEFDNTRYQEITTGSGAVKGDSGARGYGMTEIPLGIELNGMSTVKCHINGYFVDAGHGMLGITESWPRSAVKTNYDAGGITHINHVGEWAKAKSDIGIYNADFVSDFASVYQDYCPNRPDYSESKIRGCIGMELVNTSDNRTRNDRYLYDETMKILAPQGINMFVFCEDDAHEFSDCDRNAQFFIMPSNDRGAKNIEACMKSGQFYTCSKNSKNPYELGDGFNATGEYPSVSYVGVDEEKNQIIVTVKNANKARMVADGNLVETIDTTLNENTVVFDLNKFENKINSYVRAYFTGPGGILYLQTFIVKKTEAERPSVQFVTPSADTEVKVYDANGSIIDAVNSDYLYLLEPGNYTYIASRPGYVTTQAIPFTVTQQEYNNNVKKKINVTLEVNSDLVYTYFYVPETIYLSGTDNRTFESYVDRQNTPDGELNRAASATGNIYFEREGASDIRITYNTVEGVSVNSLNAVNLESAGPKLTGTINSGIMSTSLGSGEHSMIEWTASYKCDGRDMVSKAYTYIYAPLSGGNSAIAAGGYAETNKALGWLHSTMSITATMWAVGLHGISGGYAGYKYSPNGGQTLVSSSGVGSITTTGMGMGTADDKSNGGSKSVEAGSGTGVLMIDTSRYNNFGQIPGLRFGLDINNASSDEDFGTNYVEFNGQRVFEKTDKRTGEMSGQRIFESSSTNNPVNCPIDTTQSQIGITGYASCSKESRTDSVKGNLLIELSYVNKDSLRARYNNAIKFAYQPDWFENTEDYNSYVEAIKNAERVLGNPASNASEINDASNAVTAAMNGVTLVQGSATVNHVDKNGNILDTETVSYTMCDTIVVSSKDIEGYTYSESWTETNERNIVVNEGTDEYKSLMTLKTAYTFNFIYEANKFDVTYNSPDASYISDAKSFAEYNAQYTLPSSVPQKVGYDFSGWYLDADGKVYPAGGKVEWTFLQDGEFTAEWTPKTYKALFDVNGGNSSYGISQMDVTFDDICNIPEEIPEKKGYAFVGWDVYDSANNLIGTYTAGGRFVWTYAENLNFVAKWDIVELTLSFDSKGGTQFESRNVSYGAEYGELPAPVKEGCHFDGWYFDEDYTMPVQPTTVVTLTEDHTVYAKWSVGSYTITYKVDDKVYASETYDFGETVKALSAPAKEGYTFSGWSPVPSTMPANDVEVTGTFTINKYKLTYMLDGSVYKEFELNYGEQIETVTPADKEGYTFTGWGNVPSVMPANDVVVSGGYTVNEYTLTYYVDGAIYATEKHNYGEDITMLILPPKNGYTFSGWDASINTMPAENVNIYGAYTLNEYHINYYIDGELYKTQTYHYQDAVTPVENPVKPGYDFSGWGVIPSKMPARDVTVNGSFIAKQISYYFLIDNKIISSYTIRGTVGTPITAPDVTAPENYEFSGWSPSVPSTMGPENVFFYGTFNKVKSFIDFDLNGGSGAVPSKTAYTVGSTISLPSAVVKSGYNFGGWAETADAQTGVYNYTVTDKDTTFYAVWIAIPAAVEPADNTDTVVNAVTKLISGLVERITTSAFTNDYIEVTGTDAELTIEQGLGFGTGSKAILSQSGKTVVTYEIVIYGDVDGDGIADGRDVQMAQMLADGMLTQADVSASVFEAADCDHNGVINDNDVQLIIGSGIMTQTIDQTK